MAPFGGTKANALSFKGVLRSQCSTAVYCGCAGSSSVVIDEFAHQRGLARLDPDLPVDAGLTEGIVIHFHTGDTARSD